MPRFVISAAFSCCPCAPVVGEMVPGEIKRVRAESANPDKQTWLINLHRLATIGLTREEIC
jgi:hypothetical protein